MQSKPVMLSSCRLQKTQAGIVQRARTGFYALRSVTACTATARDVTDGEQPRSVGQIAASIAAVACMSLASPSIVSAEELYAAGPRQYAYPAAERYAEKEEARFDENLQTKELKDLLSLLQQGNPNLADLEAARLKVGFQRGVDGRVSLQGQSDKHWYSIKNDMQSPGFILARDQQDGRVFFLPPDESGRLMQIDLSDDVVVGQLFGSGAWQDVMEQLEAEDLNGNVVPLILDEADFRNTLSLLEDAEEAAQAQ